MGVAVFMHMTVFVRMVMSILVIVVMVVFMVMHMLMVVCMRDARGMQRLVLLLRQFVPDGLRHSILDIFSFFLSSPRHYSTSSASTNTLMV
jgi:hypothetical protein